MRIVALDQIDLPRSRPELERLLALNSGVNVCKRLKPHEFVDFVFPREAAAFALTMLNHPAIDVVGHADVECALGLARENINKVGPFLLHLRVPSLGGVCGTMGPGHKAQDDNGGWDIKCGR